MYSVMRRGPTTAPSVTGMWGHICNARCRASYPGWYAKYFVRMPFRPSAWDLGTADPRRRTTARAASVPVRFLLTDSAGAYKYSEKYFRGHGRVVFVL